MRKKSAVVSFLFFLIILFINPLPSEEKKESVPSASILSRVDSILSYPEGELEGSMVHISPGGKAKAYGIRLSVSEEGLLFVFSTEYRGDELKVLYNRKGEDIWAFDPVINQLFNKRYTGLFDPVMSTNYFFIDLISLPFEKNYTLNKSENISLKNIDYLKLELIPKQKNFRYAMLAVYVGRDDNIPVKIDFLYADKKVYKTLSIDNQLKQNDKIISMRYEMLDCLNGSTTLIEFTKYDSKKKFDKKTFNHERGGGF